MQEGVEKPKPKVLVRDRRGGAVREGRSPIFMARSRTSITTSRAARVGTISRTGDAGELESGRLKKLKAGRAVRAGKRIDGRTHWRSLGPLGEAKWRRKLLDFIKLQVPAGKANPSPPIGPALGQRA